MISSHLLSRLSARRGPLTATKLREEYDRLSKQNFEFKDSSEDSNPNKIRSSKVFANNSVDLGFVSAYGFDFDHTLANYNEKLNEWIYQSSIEYLVKELNYPNSLLKQEYDPDWCIRGLQFDKKTGNLMKLNQFYQISPSTIFNGKQSVDISSIIADYGGLRISSDYFDKYFRELNDLFCIPEGILYSTVIEELNNLKYNYDSAYIFEDIRQSLNYLHDGGLIHKEIEKNIEGYLSINENNKNNLIKLFEILLNSNNKIKTFLLTNSRYQFINKSCEYLFDDVCKSLNLKSWHDCFNYIIVQAHKPNWFFKNNRSFRLFDREKGRLSFTNVTGTSLQEHEVYEGGCIKAFEQLTNIKNDNVIYFGDNLTSDITGPFRSGQWKTCAIIPELENEISVINTNSFKNYLLNVMNLESIIFESQFLLDENSKNIISKLRDNRNILRNKMKILYNKQFGSIFRTHKTRTLFYHKLGRYSDLYTSNITNFIYYPLNYQFESRRQFYEHEPNYWLDNIIESISSGGNEGEK